MQKVDIIIVNWNTGRLLARCLESLRNLPEQHEIRTIYVVDNNSSDTSLAEAKKVVSSWDKVVFLPLPQNVGFAAANNRAIQRSSTDTHVLLLNPDTEMKPGSVSALLSALSRNPKVGVVGPRLFNSDGTPQPSVRAFPTLPVLVALFLKLHGAAARMGFLRTYFQHQFDYATEQTVEQVMGACFLIRRQTLQEVGMLDESFFVWFEEVDFCKRATDKGWEILYTPSASVIHHGGASFHQLVGFQKSLPMLKSALRYSRKHLGMISTAVLLVLTPFAVLLTLPATFAHTLKRTQNTQRL